MSFVGGALPGDYLELATPIHRAPALVKGAVVVAALVAVSVVDGFFVLGAVVAASVALALVARLPATRFRAIALGLVFFAAMTVVATMLLGGADGAGFPHSAAAAGGRMLASARATLRAAAALMLVGAFTLTTPPERLVEECAALVPRRRGAPRGGDFLLAVIIAFRLVPLLGEEFLRIRRARAARGVSVDAGTRRERLAGLGDLYAACMAAVLRRVDEMSLALEARGCRG